MIFLERYTEFHPSLEIVAILSAPNPFGGVIEHSVRITPEQIDAVKVQDPWDEHDVAVAASQALGQTVQIRTPTP